MSCSDCARLKRMEVPIVMSPLCNVMMGECLIWKHPNGMALLSATLRVCPLPGSPLYVCDSFGGENKLQVIKSWRWEGLGTRLGNPTV